MHCPHSQLRAWSDRTGTRFPRVVRCLLSLVCVWFMPGSGTAGDGEGTMPASIDYLVNIFIHSPEEALRQYGGRALSINGYVHESGRDDQGRPYLVLFKFSARTTHTRCYFPPDRAEEVERLPYHSLVNVVGVCRGLDAALDAVVFTECRIVDDGDDAD